MVAEQAATIEELQRSSSKPDESEPKEADYNGDWTKYQADYAAWKAAKTVEAKFDEREQRESAQRLQERRQEAIDDFQERAEQVKVGIPDYDTALEAFAKNGGKFADHVREELLESEKGPMLAYQLAKNSSACGATECDVSARRGPRNRPARSQGVSASTQKANTGTGTTFHPHRWRIENQRIWPRWQSQTTQPHLSRPAESKGPCLTHRGLGNV
jgi:hypothetical protein